MADSDPKRWTVNVARAGARTWNHGTLRAYGRRADGMVTGAPPMTTVPAPSDHTLVRGRRVSPAAIFCAVVVLASGQCVAQPMAVLFDKALAEIRPEELAKLEEKAEFLKANPEYAVSVQGRTDPGGRPEADRELRAERGRAVAEYLVRKLGVNPAQVVEKTSTVERGATCRNREYCRRTDLWDTRLTTAKWNAWLDSDDAGEVGQAEVGDTLTVSLSLSAYDYQTVRNRAGAINVTLPGDVQKDLAERADKKKN